MALIFDNQQGRVGKIEATGQTTTAMITFPSLDSISMYMITTQIGTVFRPVYQVNDTLGDDVYLVSFGETITPMPLSGIIYATECGTDTTSGGGTATRSTSRDGIRMIMDWWHSQNLLSQREPVSLTLGSDYAVKVFISDLELTAQDPENEFWYFTMTLLRVPQRHLNESVTQGTSGDSDGMSLGPAPPSTQENLEPYSDSEHFTDVPPMQLTQPPVVWTTQPGPQGIPTPSIIEPFIQRTALSPVGNIDLTTGRAVAINPDGSTVTTGTIAASGGGYTANRPLVGPLSGQ